MFILYAIPIGLVLGFLVGGRITGLERLQFRWARIALGGLAVQLVLFSGPVTDRIGALGTPLYVGSTLIVLAALLRNLAIPGMAIVALGAVSNLTAIVANGGSMPASAEALTALGKEIGDGYSNSVAMAHPALGPLTDIFAMPRWMPLANVYSVGDVLIGVGIAIAVAAAMRGAPGNLPPEYPRPGTNGPWPPDGLDRTVASETTTASR